MGKPVCSASVRGARPDEILIGQGARNLPRSPVTRPSSPTHTDHGKLLVIDVPQLSTATHCASVEILLLYLWSMQHPRARPP